MSHVKSLGPKRTQPIKGSDGGHFPPKIEDLSIEEILKQVNIQSNLLDLQSKDEGKVKSALNTLSVITRHTGRKDALYVLIGYYQTEIRTIDEIIDFFYFIEMAFLSRWRSPLIYP